MKKIQEEQRNQVMAIIQTQTNASLVRMLDKAQEKQLNNLTLKLTETLSTSLTKVVASIFEIKKGQVRECKRIR